MNYLHSVRMPISPFLRDKSILSYRIWILRDISSSDATSTKVTLHISGELDLHSNLNKYIYLQIL